ncbi:hypothetical protein Tco_0378788 [Tanacetum coccineum]
MSNTNNNMQPQTSSVLQNDTTSLCLTSKVQEKTQLSRIKCMNSLRAIQSQLKFLIETLQDFGNMPIFKRTFSQDLDLLENHLTKEIEQHLTKDILSWTDCTTTLTNLRTKFENAFNSEFEERMRKYTRYNAQSFNDAMICTIDSIRKYMLEIILHQQRTLHLLKQKTLMQTQEDHSHQTQAVNSDSLKSNEQDTYFVQYTGIEVQQLLRYSTPTPDQESKLSTVKHMEADLVDHMKSIGQTTNARMTTACREYTDAEEAISDQYRRNPMAEETSNKAKIEKEIDVLETMNIELEHSVATLQSAFVKPDHMIASSSSRNSSKNMPRFSSNDMVHNHYLDKARKKTQERDRNSKTSVMPSARFQSTADGSKPKPREQQSTSRKFAMYLRDSRYDKGCVPPKQSTLRVLFFSPNSKQFVVLHVPSNKTTNRNKPVEQIRIAKKPERQIPTGHRFSIKKTSAVHEKTMTLRSCLRWKPTGKIFRTVGLRWVPTGKIFTPSTTKSMAVEKADISETIVKVDSQMMIQKMTSVHNNSGLKP